MDNCEQPNAVMKPKCSRRLTETTRIPIGQYLRGGSAMIIVIQQWPSALFNKPADLARTSCMECVDGGGHGGGEGGGPFPRSVSFELRVHLSGPKSALCIVSHHPPFRALPSCAAPCVSISTPTSHPHPPPSFPRLIVNFTAQCPGASRGISRSPCVPRGLTDERERDWNRVVLPARRTNICEGCRRTQTLTLGLEPRIPSFARAGPPHVSWNCASLHLQRRFNMTIICHNRTMPVIHHITGKFTNRSPTRYLGDWKKDPGRAG
jgi:hypothetical protein